ncbi:MAG: bifunctional protein-serine/threonine kinase/phosphatase [Pseudomonadota bacterium]|nr:bifunctional protein-serine/threonine kinase/phosphatase [Pseudomonadota bacterium]
MTRTLSIATGWHTRAGRKTENEDHAGAAVPEDPLLTSKGVCAVIADGMSTSEDGGQASRLSVSGFIEDYYSTPETWTVKKSAGRVITALNRWLYGQGQHVHGTHKGFVTTLSALVVKSATAYLFHVGDTRIYRLRGNELECLTTDHRVTVSADREYLSRAMGIDLNVEIDYRALPVEEGDVYVMTTDGVHDYLSSAEIVSILSECDVTHEVADRIVDSAFGNGSHDNLTCQVLRVDSLPDAGEDAYYSRLTALPFPPDLEPGMVLDGYRIQRELHATSHIQVYLAVDTQDERKVVLKTPSVNFQDDPNYIDMFVHEEWIGKRIDNAHVMKVCGATRKRQCLYYVAEYIEGQTLRQWLDDHPRPSLGEVRDIVGQIAEGLRAFHRLDMIHQDMKPENVMIDHHGVVKIIDFGSTRVSGLEEIASPLDRQYIVGTLAFSAAEYFRGQQGTKRSDIFSLGVITYQMLSGELPYGKPLSERALRHVKYHSVSGINPEVPEWMDAALRKAVAIDPARRYDTLSEFVYDLSHPNPSLLDSEKPPLLERNPVLFWKGVSVILLIVNLLVLYICET